MTLAAFSLVLLVTFGLFSWVRPFHNPYIDFIGYLVLPGFFVSGLLIVPLGIWIHVRALKRGGRGTQWTTKRLDFSNPHNRKMAVVFVCLNLFFVLPLIAVSSYQGYHYSESTEFCSNVCHAVMEPQATTHASSPHARVACAECHIGEGAGWFVKSKLSGLGQVVAVLRDTYSRPIPPAITELRPARETCEQCHWPAKFFGAQLKEITRFSSDQSNTRHTIRMLLKTGGADESIGRVEGIHMHMALSGPIDYVATDPHLQNIPWVRYSKSDGTVLVYRSDGLPNTAPPPEGVERRVDCMDCHNRGAHHFRPPQDAVDMYLAAGMIDAGIPFIKREMVHAMIGKDSNRPEGGSHVADRLREFYRRQHPEVWTSKQAQIEQASTLAAQIHERNFFPSMNVDWQSYPDNIGHMRSAGCFRCHDGQHIDSTGRALPSDCDVCHTFLIPVEGKPNAFEEGRFRHSMNLYLHENLRCDQCHAGDVLPTCRDCHASGDWLENRGQDWFEWSKTHRPPGQ